MAKRERRVYEITEASGMRMTQHKDHTVTFTCSRDQFEWLLKDARIGVNLNAHPKMDYGYAQILALLTAMKGYHDTWIAPAEAIAASR